MDDQQKIWRGREIAAVISIMLCFALVIGMVIAFAVIVRAPA